MIVLIILFTFSLLALVILILGKVWEQKSGRLFFTTRYLSKYDSLVLEKLSLLNKTIKKNQHNIAFFITHGLPYKFIKLFSVVKNKFDERYNQFAHKIRGRYVIKKRETVSTFIKDISEHKNNLPKE